MDMSVGRPRISVAMKLGLAEVGAGKRAVPRGFAVAVGENIAVVVGENGAATVVVGNKEVGTAVGKL